MVQLTDSDITVDAIIAVVDTPLDDNGVLKGKPAAHLERDRLEILLDGAD